MDYLDDLTRRANGFEELALGEDLHTAGDHISAQDSGALPVDKHGTVDITYPVLDSDDDAPEWFGQIADRVTELGGTVDHYRPPVREDGARTVHHTATLPFGTGRVRYRAVWLERLCYVKVTAVMGRRVTSVQHAGRCDGTCGTGEE